MVYGQKPKYHITMAVLQRSPEQGCVQRLTKMIIDKSSHEVYNHK